jgi:hypothetical protein
MFILNFNNNTDNPVIGTLVIYHQTESSFKHYVDRIDLSDVKAVDEEIAKAKEELAFLQGKKESSEVYLNQILEKLNA